MNDRRVAERGATAVVVAASALLLFGVVAIAIDIGAGFSERRQAQTAADFGSLSALQFAQSCNPCSLPAAVDAGAAEAIAVANANLPNQTLDWAACTDPNRPANFTRVSSTSQCVSFTSNLDRSRVVVPTASVDTTFGAVLGANEVRVSATAEAGLVDDSVSNILPFAAGSGSSMCLFSNQAPQTVPPCNGPQSGAFGYLDIFLYGSDDLGTPDNCGIFNSNKRLAINIAVGTDHLLSVYTAGAAINDQAACPNKNEEPNQLEIQTGSPTSGITDGLLDGTTGPNFTGRLICGAGPCDTVRGWSIDDTPLWTFLVDGDAIAGGLQCPANTSITVSDRASMDLCIQSWSFGGPIMFTEAIGAHPRFAAVPEFVAYPTASSPPADRNIVAFAPVYLETIYMRCNANRCSTVHSPGEPNATYQTSCSNPLLATETHCGFGGSNPSDSIEGLTAFSIELEMLPVATRELIPGANTVREFLLIK